MVVANTGLRVGAMEQERVAGVVAARLGSMHGDAKQYLQRLKSGDEKEWDRLLTILTVGESYFFRDRDQFELLRRWVLPALIEKASITRRLRFWSAGCAGGEEAYSLAIMLDELLPDRKGWKVEILGTDIEPLRLQSAVKGHYSEWSLRGRDETWRRRYFRHKGNQWFLLKSLRDMVSFRQHNLLLDAPPQDMDLILCRNVFIYFDHAAVASALQQLTRALHTDGYLLTGHGELFGHTSVELGLRHYPEGIIYQHSPGETRQADKAGVSAVSTRPAAEKKTTINAARPEAVDGGHSRQHKSATITQQAVAAMPAFSPVLAEAFALADRGLHQAARARLDEAGESSLKDPCHHYLLALLAEAVGAWRDAGDSYRRALELNPELVPAQVELAELMAREGDHAGAEHWRTEARRRLEQLAPQTSILPYDGVSAADLLNYLNRLQQEVGIDER